jgi:hypothetical protein
MAVLGRWPSACVAAIVLVLCAAALTVVHRQPRQPLPAHAAIADALRSPTVERDLAGMHWRASASAIDGQNERVSFFTGSRMVVDVLVRADGTLGQVANLRSESVPYGDWIAYQPTVLVALGLLFVLMVGVLPLRRVRNLDVLATLSLLAPVVLLDERYIAASAISAAPGVCWLGVRCALRALGPPRPAPASVSLLERLTGRWPVSQRVRVLRLVLLALVLVFVMVGVSSPSADDVAYAVMEGATWMIHGVLPYGHLPGDVFHGDTYPILSYALYTPLALASPVNDIFSSVDLALAAAVAAALTSAALLARAGARSARRLGRAEPLAELGGLRAAIALLSFPPLLITVSAGTTDAALGAMLLLAVLMWRAPAASSAMLAVGAWFKLAPLALVPIWLAPRRGRSLAWALGGLLAVSLASAGLVVALGGLSGLVAMVHAIGYQFDRESPQSVWYALGITQLQPIGEALVLSLVAGATVRLWREPGLAQDRVRLAALSAAIMLGLQFTSSQWAFMYLAWVLPLAGLSLFTDPLPVSVAEPASAPRPESAVASVPASVLA